MNFKDLFTGKWVIFRMFFPQRNFFFSNNLNVYLYIDSVILIGAVDMWIKINGSLLTEYAE
jgi:hypothetical protein